MFLKPHGRIDLEHRAFVVRGSATGSIAVAGTDDSRLTIIRPDFETTESLQLPAAVGAMSLHPSKPLLAWVDGESGLLKVQTLEGESISESYCYLDTSHALAGTNEHRIFLVNTNQMRLEEEIAVENHEPRPIGEYFPTLADEPGLCTDLGWFTRIGDVVVFFWERDGGKSAKAWKDSFLWYRVPTSTARSS
jgi:hypothetical protein